VNDQDSPLLGPLRRDLILKTLSRQGVVKVTQLSQVLGCSDATLRRDLHEMEELGLLRRTHGGALPSSADTASREQRPRDKAVLCVAEKRAIGQLAATLVSPGDAIALNGGTTTLEVARAARIAGSMRVVTNSLGVAYELVDQPNVEVTVLGGKLRSSLEMSGIQTEQLLEGVFVNTAFIGVDGLTAKHGLTTCDQPEAMTNHAILAHAERVVVVADHTKIGRLTMALIAPITAAHILITDTMAPEGELSAIRNAGVDVLLAE